MKCTMMWEYFSKKNRDIHPMICSGVYLLNGDYISSPPGGWFLR
jgi:hypothetical protein